MKFPECHGAGARRYVTLGGRRYLTLGAAGTLAGAGMIY
jgi:hypothetical protein